MHTYGGSAAKAQELYDSGKTSEDAEWTALIDEINAFRPDDCSRPPVHLHDGRRGRHLHDAPLAAQQHLPDSVNFGEIRIWAGETEATTPWC